MKNKTKLILPLLLVFMFLVPAAINNNASAKVIASDPFIIGIDTIFEGYQPDSGAGALGLSAVYNASIPVIGLQLEGFTDEGMAPNDFRTDGITRTFSDSYWGAIFVSPTLESAKGIYQTLKGIQESEFSQYITERDAYIYTYTPLEDYYTTINDTMYALDPAWDGQNFTCGDMYHEVTFDKVLMDTLFAAFKAKTTYDTVAEEYSTNKQMITTLLDDVFGEYLFDIIYAPVNVTDYADDWTIAEEVRAVMGGNATDNSINGTTKIVSVRNAMIGYIGERLAADSVVQNALSAYVTDDTFFGFEQTATTYMLKFRTKADFISSPLDTGYSGLFSIFQPGEIEIAGKLLQIFWLEALLIAAGAGLVAGLIALAYGAKAGKDNLWMWFVGTALVVFTLVLVIYMFATTKVLTL